MVYAPVGKAKPMKKLKKRYGCATEFAVDLIGGKWKTVILSWLKERPHRYSDLRSNMPGISDKMLSQCLRELEAAGLTESGDNGHCLTADGEMLRPALEALHAWGAARAEGRGILVQR